MLAAPSWSPKNIMIRELQTQLLAVRTSVICALNQLLDLKDLNTGVHSTRLAEWAVRIGRDLGLDDDCLSDLEAAAILHDIGKIGTPDNILRKPSRLTDEERAIIQIQSSCLPPIFDSTLW
jgi:HD-GYP domain-containing protein (c-di-GMP phosphodiesterase class II)